MEGKRLALVVTIAVSFAALIVVGVVVGMRVLRPAEPVVDRRAPVRIGVVLPLSGRNARYGKWAQNGLTLAAELYNANMQSRYRVDFVTEDDALSPDGARDAATKLTKVNQVPAIFGTWSSSGVLQMVPIVQSAGVVLMADGISPQIREAGEWVFRCVPDARLSLKVLADYLKSTGTKTRLAIVYIDNDFGQDLSTYLKRALRDSNVEVIANEPYDATVTDFTGLLATIRAKKPTALFVAGYGEQALVFRDAQRVGLDVAKFASPSFENPDIVAQAGVAAENVIYPNYFDRENPSPELLEFMRQYDARFHEAPEAFGASAFVGMQLLLQAVNGCETATAGCMRRQLQRVETTTTILGPTTVDEVGDIRYPIFLKTVKNQQFVRQR